MNMEARRRGMMADEPGETWDYEFYAQADGTIPARNLTSSDGLYLAKNQTLTVAWDATGFDGDATRVLWSGNASGFSPAPPVLEADLQETVGQMTVTSLSNNPTFLVSRTWSTRNGPKFKGQYIKVRVNPI